MLSAVQGIQLRKTEGTKVKEGFGVKATRSNARAVLIISRTWKIVYEWLSENIKVILFTDTSVKKKFDFIDLKSYEHVEVFPNLDAGIVDWKAEKLHLKYNFTAIVCLNEEDIIRCARLRKHLGLESSGQTVQSALRYRDKVLMKEVLQADNISIPVFAPVEDTTSIIQFISIYGYPVVIKPRTGCGSVSTSVIRSEEELLSFLGGFVTQLDSPLGLEIEKFIEGPMYHVDGIVSNGSMSLAWPSCYLNYCGDFKKEKYNASYTLHPSNPIIHRIQKYVESVVQSLGGPLFFPFHGEVWHTPQDKLVLCEIASRVGGAGIRHVMEAQFGILLDRIWVQAQCNDPIDYKDLNQSWESKLPQYPCSGWIIIFPEQGRLLARPEREEGEKLENVLKYFPIAEPGEVFKVASHSADAVAQFVVKGESEEEVKKSLVMVYEWYKENCKWELM